MNKKLDFEIFLLIRNKKFHINVFNLDENKPLYEKEEFIENDTDNLFILKLNEFLNNNILKIEKKINKFVTKINIILDGEKFFPIQISIKNNNNGNIITKNSLIYPLNEAKLLCDKTIGKNKIIHMLVDNYKINGSNFTSLPDDLICNYFYIDVKFLCLSYKFLNNLENILKQQQISINRILDFDYVNSFFDDKNLNLFEKAKLIADGCNENEIKLIDKIKENKGFFEKIFNILG